MEVTVLKCTLKESVPPGTYVYFEQRNPGKEFEIIDPDPGVELNVGKLCDIKKTVMVVPDPIDMVNSEPKESRDEILKFAQESWDLAVKYEAEIKKLGEELEKLKKLTPKSIQGEDVVVPPKTITRKKKAK